MNLIFMTGLTRIHPSLQWVAKKVLETPVATVWALHPDLVHPVVRLTKHALADLRVSGHPITSERLGR
jgi:hypothetical protein